MDPVGAQVVFEQHAERRQHDGLHFPVGGQRRRGHRQQRPPPSGLGTPPDEALFHRASLAASILPSRPARAAHRPAAADLRKGVGPGNLHGGGSDPAHHHERDPFKPVKRATFRAVSTSPLSKPGSVLIHSRCSRPCGPGKAPVASARSTRFRKHASAGTRGSPPKQPSAPRGTDTTPPHTGDRLVIRRSRPAKPPSPDTAGPPTGPACRRPFAVRT